eukprot:6558849-Pyramimonas_sp.AAC.1
MKACWCPSRPAGTPEPVARCEVRVEEEGARTGDGARPSPAQEAAAPPRAAAAAGASASKK